MQNIRPCNPPIPSIGLLNLSGAPITALPFGGVPVGQSLSQSFLITNSGNSHLIVSAWTISDPSFTLSPSNPSGLAGDVTLTPGQSTQVNVVFAPAKIGSYAATVAVSSTDTNHSVVPLAISGTGVTNQTGLSVSAFASSVNYNTSNRITATVTDAYGNPATNSPVYFQATSAGWWTNYDRPTNGWVVKNTSNNGTASLQYTATEVGQVTITARTDSGITNTTSYTVNQVNARIAIIDFRALPIAGNCRTYVLGIRVTDLAGNPLANQHIDWQVSPGTVGGYYTMTTGDGQATMDFIVCSYCGPDDITVTLTDLNIPIHIIEPVCTIPSPPIPSGAIVPVGAGTMCNVSPLGTTAASVDADVVYYLDIGTGQLKTTNMLYSCNPNADIALNSDGTKVAIATGPCNLGGQHLLLDVISATPTGLSVSPGWDPTGGMLGSPRCVAWIGNYILLGHTLGSTRMTQFSLWDGDGHWIATNSLAESQYQRISNIAGRPGTSNGFGAVSDAANAPNPYVVYYGTVGNGGITVATRFYTAFRNECVAWSGDGSLLMIGRQNANTIAVYDATQLPLTPPLLATIPTEASYELACSSVNQYMAVCSNQGSTITVYSTTNDPTTWAAACTATSAFPVLKLSWIQGTQVLLAIGANQFQKFSPDSTPPTIANLLPAAGYRTSSNVVTITGQVTDAKGVQGAAISVNGAAPQTLSLNGVGGFSYATPLSMGTNSVEISATNQVGYSGSVSWTITRYVDVVSVVTTDAIASEPGTDTGSFSIGRQEASSAPLTVNYTMSGTATNGTDYNFLGGTATIPANQFSTIVTIVPIDNAVIDGDRTAVLTIGTSPNYSVDPVNSNATVTIQDNDKPTVSVMAAASNASEQGPTSGTFLLVCSGRVTAPRTYNIGYSFSGTAVYGKDYTLGSAIPVAGTLPVTLPVGTASVTNTFSVIPTPNVIRVSPESIVLTLSADPAYALGTSNATVNLAEYNPPSVSIGLGAGQSSSTTNSPINFTVTFSQVVGGFTSDDVAITGTAEANTNVVTPSGSNYNVAVSGMISNGTVAISIPAGTATNASGVPSLASGPGPSVIYARPVTWPTTTVRTVPTNLTVVVDGTSYVAPLRFNWAPGSLHTNATVSPQSGGTGMQYVWSGWSYGGGISNVITAAPSDTNYTAYFTTQYHLTMNAGAGGTVSPGSGWTNSGAVVDISATASNGYSFIGWVGSGPGSYTGTNNRASVTMNTQIEETASFLPCTSLPSPTPASPACGSSLSTQTPALGWNNVANESGYGVQIFAGGGCAGSPVHSSPPLAANITSYAVPSSAGLQNGQTYSWQVQAKGNGTTYCDSGWSSCCSFSILLCTYTLSATSTNVGAAGGSGSFRVYAESGCAWSAVAGTNWIHTSSSGSGTNTVIYTVEANTNVSPRSGVISVGGQTFTVNQAGSRGGTAAFVGTDRATQGDWQARYGAEGYVVVGDATNYPSYATVSPAGCSDYVWEWQASNDVRCLRKVTVPSERVAACWYGTSSFAIDVAVGLGRGTRLALYCLDWDCKGRAQRVELLDGVSGAVLDSQTLSNFCGGKYLVWDVSGWVRVQVTPLVSNAVVSGVFFDGVAASARFVGADAATQGNWKGKYGGDGYVVVNDATNYPSYATVSPAGESDYVWEWQASNDVRCLQKVTVPGERVAACWYAETNFTMDVPVGLGQATRLALYCLDWDRKGRVQQVELLDGLSGAVLDSQMLSNFTNGQYLVWDVSGWVRVRVTALLSGAVVSGVFFDGVGASVRFVGTDAATQGNWKGKYGGDGYVVVNDATNYPTYAIVSPGGELDFVWEWQASNDVRCLQKWTVPGERMAACWYGDTSFTLDVPVGLGRGTRLALYCLDWDRKGRAQEVELLDGVSGAVVDSQTLWNFSDGQYLVWDVRGLVRVRLTPLENNAVVSGVFFDEVAPSWIASISLSSEGAAQVVVLGRKGSTYYLEASNDLVTWSRVSTNVNVEGIIRLVDDSTSSQHPIRFLRVLEAR